MFVFGTGGAVEHGWCRSLCADPASSQGSEGKASEESIVWRRGGYNDTPIGWACELSHQRPSTNLIGRLRVMRSSRMAAAQIARPLHVRWACSVDTGPPACGRVLREVHVEHQYVVADR